MVACFLKARDSSSGSMEGEAGVLSLAWDWEHAYVMSVWPHCPVQCRQASGEEPKEENPFEIFAEDWDFGWGLSRPPVQRDGHRTSSIWRNHAPPARWRLQHGPTQNCHDLRSEVRTDLGRRQAPEAPSSRRKRAKGGWGEQEDPAEISRVEKGRCERWKSVDPVFINFSWHSSDPMSTCFSGWCGKGF